MMPISGLIAILFVTLVVIILLVSLLVAVQRRANRSTSETEPADEHRAEVKEAPNDALPLSIYIHGTPSAPPSGQALQYIKPSITTFFHPLLINEDGTTRMPLSDWWIMRYTSSACVGLEKDSYAFLTSHGIYHCSPNGTVKICESHTMDKQKTGLLSIHNYNNTLYALGRDGCVYKLLSSKEYLHTYLPGLPSVPVDLSEYARSWFWIGMDSFCGMPIANRGCQSMTVVRTEKEQIVYLQVDNELKVFFRRRWHSCGFVSRRGVRIESDRGKIFVITNRGEQLREGRGRTGAVCGKSNTLYTIEGSCLYRVSSEMGDVPMRIGTGWVKLLTVENGVIIGISSGMVLSL